MTIQGDAAADAAQRTDMANIEARITEYKAEVKELKASGDDADVARVTWHIIGLNEALEIVGRPRGW